MVKLKSKEYIIQEMIKSYGKDRVLVVPTKDYDFASKPKWGKNDKQRNEWLDNVVCPLYNVDRKNIIKKMRKRSTGEYSFSYIKFGINVEIYIFVDLGIDFCCCVVTFIIIISITKITILV